MNICIYIYTCIFMCNYNFLSPSLSIYKHTYVYKHVPVYLHFYVSMYMLYLYIYICISTYPSIHIYI